MQPQQYVAYYRVSTQKQGKSGLGLEAQQAAVAHYNPIAEFIEVESGKNDERVELHKAMAFAKTNNSTLIFAKLDRLSRNAAFILALMEKGVRIRCADMPDADEFQLHLYAILAHKERKMISDRTKAALSAAKARGTKLGGVQASTVDRINSYVGTLQSDLQTLIDSGMTNRSAIAKALNELGHRSPKGAELTSTQIARILQR